MRRARSARSSGRSSRSSLAAPRAHRPRPSDSHPSARHPAARPTSPVADVVRGLVAAGGRADDPRLRPRGALVGRPARRRGRADLGARQRHGARAHRRRRRCARSVSFPGVVSGGESGLHGLAVWSDEDGGRVALRVPRGRGRQPGGADAALGDAGRAQPRRCGGRCSPASRAAAPTTAAASPSARTAMLYVTTGDAQNRDAAQDPDALGGKILRLTPEGDPAPGNPFGNAVWTLGHRNVQGIAWTARRRDVGERVRPGHLGRAQSHRRRGELRLAGRSRARRAMGGSRTRWWRGPPSEASPSGIAAVGEHRVRDGSARRAAVGRRRQRLGARWSATRRSGLDGPGSTARCRRRTGRHAVDPHEQHRRAGRTAPGRRRPHPTADRAGRLAFANDLARRDRWLIPRRYGENRELPAAVSALSPLPLSRHADVSELRGRTRLPHALPPVLRPAQQPGRDRRAHLVHLLEPRVGVQLARAR